MTNHPMPDAIAAAVTRVAQAAATLRNGATRLISIDHEGAACWHVDADAMAALDAALEAWTDAGEAEIQFIRRPASARVRSFTRTLRLFREVLRARSELKESLFLLEVDPAHRSGRGRWWRANRAGYTDLIANAGLYAAGETDEMDCRARSVADVLEELDEPGTTLLALVDQHPRLVAARPLRHAVLRARGRPRRQPRGRPRHPMAGPPAAPRQPGKGRLLNRSPLGGGVAHPPPSAADGLSISPSP